MYLSPIYVWERILGKGNVGYVGENQHRQKVGTVFRKSLHAEMNALYKFYKMKRRPSNLSIYVVRLSMRVDGVYRLGLSKPCIECQKNLFRHNITKIYYTDIIDNVNVLCKMKIN